MNDITALLPLVKLRFNIEHPSFEECYVFGYECAQSDVSETENPFNEGTSEHEQWSDGWWAGFYGEEPLFELNAGDTQAGASVENLSAANDTEFKDGVGKWLLRAIEITGVIAVSAVVGYQVLDMVA